VSVYSHSRISSFENCQLQYRYRYIDRIRRDVQSIEAFMGKTVHTVLEGIYADRPAARSATASDFGERFSRLWRESFTPEIRIVRDKLTADDYHDIGRRCVEGFFARHHPFDRGEVVGCEMKMEFTLDGDGRYRMIGYIDRIDRIEPGIMEIHDYKTGALPRRGALERDRQLTLYEIALRQQWPGLSEVRLVWHYLAHDREFVVRRSADELQRTKLDTIKSIQRIEAATRFPARTSPLCSWCEYRDICPEWSDERAAAAPRPQAVEPPPSVAESRNGQYLLF